MDTSAVTGGEVAEDTTVQQGSSQCRQTFLRMSIQTTDWSRLLHLESSLPPDVVFRVMEKADEEDMKTGQVSAHKLLLAGVSPVF